MTRRDTHAGSRLLPRARTPLMSNIPARFTWIFLAVMAASLAVFINPPVKRPVDIPQPKPAPPPQIEARIQTEGLDANQRPLPFTIYILSQELSWKLESVSDLDGSRPLLNPELSAAVNRARDVFCVGTASFEGVTRREEERAGERAATLARWVGSAVRDPRSTRVFSLNAGQYKGPPELESANQRKAIVLVADGHADDVDLGQALQSGLRKQQQEYPIVYSLLHQYSRSGRWLKEAVMDQSEISRRMRSPPIEPQALTADR